MCEMKTTPAANLKGHGRASDLEAARSKDDVMGEMRNLQDELSALDKRLNRG